MTIKSSGKKSKTYLLRYSRDNERAAKSLSLEHSHPASNFAVSHDWNILFSRKVRWGFLNHSLLHCFRSEIVFFATRVPSFTAMAASATCSRHLFLAGSILKVLSFGPHMHSSWDWPFTFKRHIWSLCSNTDNNDYGFVLFSSMTSNSQQRLHGNTKYEV